MLITDKLKNYTAAKREIMPGVEHRQHKGLNNRAENAHQPTRRRERIMKRFKSRRQVQRFLSIHDQIANVFSRRPDHDTATKFRAALKMNPRSPDALDSRRVLLSLSDAANSVLASLSAVHLDELSRLRPVLKGILRRI